MLQYTEYTVLYSVMAIFAALQVNRSKRLSNMAAFQVYLQCL